MFFVVVVVVVHPPRKVCIATEISGNFKTYFSYSSSFCLFRSSSPPPSLGLVCRLYFAFEIIWSTRDLASLIDLSL